MNRLGVGYFSRANNSGNIQVTLRGGSWTNAHRFIGEHDVLCIGVGFRMHRYCFDSQFPTGALDSEGDFASIGDENLLKHEFVSVKFVLTYALRAQQKLIKQAALKRGTLDV